MNEPFSQNLGPWACSVSSRSSQCLNLNPVQVKLSSISRPRINQR